MVRKRDKGADSPAGSDEQSTGSDSTAVIGVAVAGVLASFTIPGPYDWGSTTIGLVLLLVLLAYGDVPSRRDEAAATAGVAAFVLLLTTGRLIDVVFEFDGWSEDPNKTREDNDKPSRNNGLLALGVWALYALSIFAAMRWWISERSLAIAASREYEARFGKGAQN